MPEKPNSSELLKTTFRALAQAGAEAAHTIQNVVLPPRREILQKQEKNWALLASNKKSQIAKNKTLTKSTTSSALQKALHPDHVPSELKSIINNWSRLPEAVRAAIIILSQQGEQSK